MKQQSGMIALMSVMIIAAVMLMTVATVTILSIGEGQASLALFKGEEALHIAEGCAEDVLERVHNNSGFSASSISIPEGVCSITYALGGPTNWDLTITGPAGQTYTRKIRLMFTRGSTITLTNWTEI